MDWNALLNTVVNWLTTSGVKVLIALAVLFISFKVVNFIAKRITKRCEKKNVDKTISRTLVYVFKLGMKLCIAICLIGYVGIDTSGLAALVTSLGVCAGLAVNGALSNLAGGIMLILTRPFKIDDYIEVESTDVAGTVEDIQIVCTKLRTPDNKVIYVPNGTLSNSNIINYSEKDTRRLDFDFAISYETDFEKAREIVSQLCSSHSLVLTDPAPMVRILDYGDSGVKITARVWVNNSDYWTVKFDILESIKKGLDENKISIPYNQLDVHIKSK